MMMNCEAFRSRWHEMQDADRDQRSSGNAAAAADWREHLTACEACGQYAADMSRVTSLLDELGEASHLAFDQAMTELTPSATGCSTLPATQWRGRRWSALAAAAVLALAAMGLAWQYFHAGQPSRGLQEIAHERGSEPSGDSASQLASGAERIDTAIPEAQKRGRSGPAVCAQPVRFQLQGENAKKYLVVQTEGCANEPVEVIWLYRHTSRRK